MTPQPKRWLSLISLLVTGHVAALLVWLNMVRIGPWYAQSCGWPFMYWFDQDAGAEYKSPLKLLVNMAVGAAICVATGLWVEVARRIAGYGDDSRWQIRLSTVLWWTTVVALCGAWWIEHRKLLELRSENQNLEHQLEFYMREEND